MKRFNADPFPTDTPATYPSKRVEELFTAILSLKNQKEAAAFFRDLLTMPEITEFANRWQMVKLLYEGRPYTAIAKELKVSTATVTRVAHWLNNGFGGYKKAADTLFTKKWKDSHVPDSHYRSGKSRGLKNPHVL